MHTKLPKILAIDPGTKEIGVAVLQGTELSYFGVKTIKRRQPSHALLMEISHYVTGLIREHQPRTLAIETTFLIQRNTALLNVAAVEIKQAAKQHGLAVYEYATAKVRKAVCQGGKATKRETARRVAERFPVLARHLRQPTQWEELYWANMFDAVAVGLVCLNEIYGCEDGMLEGER